jgi:hypothetical protein
VREEEAYEARIRPTFLETFALAHGLAQRTKGQFEVWRERSIYLHSPRQVSGHAPLAAFGGLGTSERGGEGRVDAHHRHADNTSKRVVGSNLVAIWGTGWAQGIVPAYLLRIVLSRT